MRKPTTKLPLKICLVLALVLTGLTGLSFVRQHQQYQALALSAKHEIALANAGKPSLAPATIKPTTLAIDSYQVPGTDPRYLTIPKLGVQARVYAVGLTSSNAIGTPHDVYDTAWYKGSSLPGQPGATLIDGHVSSWTTDGVFYNLKQLVPGDAITVQTGSGTKYVYTVVKTQVYSSGDVNVSNLLAPIDKSKPGLNLITCTGSIIAGSNEFNQRVVVFASLVSQG